MALPANGLVVWTSGNVSARDQGTGAIAIKPSGVPYHVLTEDQIVVLDIDGHVVEGSLKPSADTATHLYIYRNRADISSVVHTHSPYATAWAALGKSIPAVLTSIADVFGGPIPCGRFVPIGEEDIAQEVLRVCGHSPAVLLQNHGVFCLGSDVPVAVRAAVMTEEVAKIVMLAMSLGTPIDLPSEFVAAQHAFYLSSYGQRSNTRDEGPSRAEES